MKDVRTVGIVLFEGVEVIDFAGPLEVFGITGEDDPLPQPFSVFTVAERSPVVAKLGLSITPTYTFDDAPQPDILIVPGGGGFHADGTPWGRRAEMHNPAMLDFVRRMDKHTELTLSVCSGTFILATAGLLEGRRVTTTIPLQGDLQTLLPEATVVEGVRWVDAGHIVTSAGATAGITMSLNVVARLLGNEAARTTARTMEYDWEPEQPDSRNPS
jgi:transcriptional regulator GlxA family with amidase domain